MTRSIPPRSRAEAPLTPAPRAPRPARRALLAAGGLGALATLAACSDSRPDAPSGAGSASDAGSAGDAGGGPVTDWTGTPMQVEGVRRVVALDGTGVDVLRELELEPVGAQPMDTVHADAYFGKDSACQAIGGSFFEPAVEQILALRPDLVIGAASVHGALREALGGIPLFLNSFTNAQADENLRRLARLTGRTGEAETAIARWTKTLTAYQPIAEGATGRDTTVLSMYGGATKDIGIDAADSTIGELLSRYTAYPWPKGSEGEGGFVELSVEELVEVDPARIWVLDFGLDPDAPPLLDVLAKRPAWTELSAVRNGTVRSVPGRWWGTTAGTRGQQLYLDEVMPTVYPDSFDGPRSGL